MGSQTRRDRAVAIGSLLVLSPIGAELLAAYDDSTGRPGELLFSIVFFALLYGCPALLIRELARRTGRGWPAMLMLMTAAGLLQAGVIDQSLFADNYGEVKGWEKSLRDTYISPLGVGAFFLQGFVLGHVVYSFGAPVAVAEAMRPGIAHRPWLGRRGIVAAGAGWLLVAGAILADTLGGDDHGTLLEVLVTLAVVVALVMCALRLPPRPRPARPIEAPRLRTVAALAFLAASAHALMPETWLGVAGAVLITTASLALLAHTVRTREWTIAHAAALATGAVISRGVLAFTYFPLVGETAAVPKYTHNIVMLLIVATAGAYAVRRARTPVLLSS
ncbi:hypothetical protein [Baekduia sp. Peel2402]|uniref:hypothetical protein n=1 Tax=Baekduia sp. Peel2402 TaxID=3458296 RepID=UPI00403ED131